MKKILILFGGNSFEHEVSCKSAKTILDNIDNNIYDVTASYIDKSNNWYLFNEETEILLNPTKINLNHKIDNIIDFLKEFDKVFPIIHGNDEENGNLPGFFNLFNIPYVGSNVLASSISYDKEITKIICSSYDIPQVNYITIRDNQEVIDIPLSFPVIIKPASCGSSIGINVANNLNDAKKYIKTAFNYDTKVIVEEFVKSRELECAVLEDEELKISRVGEIKSCNDFYDYEAKYVKNSNLIIPANIDESLEKEIRDYSKKIFKILSLSNLSRIDFLYDYEHQLLYFNEVNTMPGFTNISMYPLLFNEDGLTTKELISKLLEY